MINPEISKFLQERIEANDFPSAVYLVAEKGEIVFRDALGYAVVEAKGEDSEAAKVDTVYDLASLTKPLVTGLLIAALIEHDRLKLSDPVRSYLDEFDNDDKRDITIGRLLLHTSGMTAWKPFYLEVLERSEVCEFVARLPRKQAVDSMITYSDLNFTVLMFLVERLHGKRIDEAAREDIFAPISLQDTLFNPLSDVLMTRIAASEFGNEYERQTCVEMGYSGRDDFDRFFRSYQIWGEVHDLNAYFMDGVAGHAGLFSTAEEVFKIALQFLPNYSRLLKPETCEHFRTNFTPGMNEARSIAFQLAATPESTAGSLMPPESFGHLGFTGTSLWIDPVNERIFILLTNRTHAHPLPFVNINFVRRRFHDLAIQALDKKA